jgi:hypothetical protein
MLKFNELQVSAAHHTAPLATAVRSFCNQPTRYLFVTNNKKQLFL